MAQNKLERSLGFWDVLLFAVGGIVGAGIYAIIGEAAVLAGSMLWLSFALAAIVAFLTGLSYAEFVGRFPDAGGSFEYFKQSFGVKTALFLSIFMMFTGIVAAATISISFAEYLSRIWQLPMWLCTSGIICLMALFNIFGSKYSSYFNMVATFVTIAGLIAVVVVSLPDIGNYSLLTPADMGYTGIIAGSALIFFSYVGFEDTVKMAEETKKPETNLPRAIILSSIIVFLLYVTIAVCAVSVLGAANLAESAGPLAAVIESKIGKIGGSILIFVALFATSKTILSNILGTSRLLYDIARDTDIEWLKKFTRVSGIGNAPNNAIIAISAVAILFALIGDLAIVASISNLFIYIVFATVNFALLWFRYQESKQLEKFESKINTGNKDSFRVPINVKHIPLPSVLALVFVLILFGFNILNLTR